MSYVAIAEQIKTILEGVSSIKSVYDYEPKELGESPVACVTAQGHNNSFNDTAGNRREYTFMIRIYYRIGENEQGVIDPERILRSVTDEIITAIESNVTLNGSCHFATPSQGRFLYAEREVKTRLVEITITAKKRVLR